MGFSHNWQFKQAYSDETWHAIELDGLALLTALPKSLAAERKARNQARPSALLRMGIGLLNAWSSPWQVLATRPDGALCGPEPHGARAFRFASCHADPITGEFDEVLVANIQGESWAKTMAHKHDRALIGILCLAAEQMPGNVWIQDTDAEDAYFLACVDWAESVLGRKLRVPDGLEFSAHRNGASLAQNQAATLDADLSNVGRSNARARGAARL